MKITDRNKDVLDAFNRLWQEHSAQPTIAEIMKATEINSSSQVSNMLDRLTVAKMIEYKGGHYFPLGMLEHIEKFFEKGGENERSATVGVTEKVEVSNQGTSN